ncbi:MAG TPA: phosphatidate cytidylyltransferase [Candidatus Dormibacteraeota bacterium]|nr:phosphatidate cytidylyltransferase [Candidatus Dormibacteraeota bacterium]
MKQRILTAAVALILFIPFVLYGGWPFALFVYVMATIGLTELLRMCNISKFSLLGIVGYLFLWLILIPNNEMNVFSFSFTKIEVVILFVMLLLFTTVITKNKFAFDQAAFVFLSTIYVGIGFYFLVLARMNGLNYVLFALFIIWATDTGAYFFGNALGKKKLWPEISPNKTFAGAIGGILIACIVGVIFQLVYPFDHSLVTILLVAITTSIVGQIGDLVASAYKRHYEIKDSGNILPGHGGILDRMDSLIFVLPFLYVIQFIS